MPIDDKYGKVVLERGNVGQDEPVIVFRAQDEVLPKLLAYYHLFCLREGSPRDHLDRILNVRNIIMTWQCNNKCKLPD